ncbi:MAG: hypothetical protein IJ809_05330 [Clostridia bacterium]|nr:hypothetical protein [Clostridia bacterium]
MKNKILTILSITIFATLLFSINVVYGRDFTVKSFSFGKKVVAPGDRGMTCKLESNIEVQDDEQPTDGTTRKRVISILYHLEDNENVEWYSPLFPGADGTWAFYISDTKPGEKYVLEKICFNEYLYDSNGNQIGDDIYCDDIDISAVDMSNAFFTISDDYYVSNDTKLLSNDGSMPQVGLYDKLAFSMDTNIEDPSLLVYIEGVDNENSICISAQYTDSGTCYIDLSGYQIQTRGEKLTPGEYRISKINVYHHIIPSESHEIAQVFGWAELSDYQLIKENVNFCDNDMRFKITDNKVEEKNVEIISEVVDIYSASGTEVNIYNSKDEIVLDFFAPSTYFAKVNDKVYANFEVKDVNGNSINGKVRGIILNFVDKNSGETLIATVRDVGIIGKTPYFVIPYTTVPGDYELTYAIFTLGSGKEFHFRNEEGLGQIKYFDFNTVLNVSSSISETKEETGYLDLENDKITESVIAKIKESSENVTVTINADSAPVIKSEVFEAIKGKNKLLVINYGANQWIFNGKDIKELKDIDVSMSMKESGASNVDSDLASMVSKALVLDYADNGNLPGKALIRIKATDNVQSYLNSDNIYVYYYNEEDKKFEKVAFYLTVSTDGYYEFYINHNSNYIITTEEVDEEFVSDTNNSLSTKIQGNDNYTVKATSNNGNNNTSNAQSNNNAEGTITINMYQLVIIVLAAVIIILIIIMFVISRRKMNNK